MGDQHSSAVMVYVGPLQTQVPVYSTKCAFTFSAQNLAAVRSVPLWFLPRKVIVKKT